MEIDKKKRLPEAYDSWLEIAMHVPSQDELVLNSNNKKIVVQAESKDPFNPATIFAEFFECDVLTLKVRAFDEIKEILPDENQLMNILLDVQRYKHAHGDPDHCKDLHKFILSLSMLINPKSFNPLIFKNK